jgi:hypothetical protein
MRYEDAYLKAHPFDRLIEGMVQPEMVLETMEIMRAAIEHRGMINVIVNNRAGGNAPPIAKHIAEKFIGKPQCDPQATKNSLAAKSKGDSLIKILNINIILDNVK